MRSQDDLIGMTATEAVMYLAAGEVSPTELLEAALTRHQEVDGAINAIPTLCVERAQICAKEITALTMAAERGLLMMSEINSRPITT